MSWTQFSPGTSSDGARMVQPSCPWPIGSYGKTTSEKKNAIARVQMARNTPPNRVAGHAINAPSTAPTAAAISAAQRKLICPCGARIGTSPQSRLSAQPAANPPAVTNVVCARLTIPPMPVTTTNDRKTIAIAKLCAMTVWSYELACNQLTLIHWNENPMIATANNAHG